ncbi:AMP-binding enzyme domain protein [Cyanobium sp. PCC 7001]|uniref:AMP-binding protein n=1 Tax=Cyanobium sp. PCC 7001 TaxID=180281 RepID=UPI0001804DDF|nr:AMP-binding protein [Cyanobium sp. PCC 7001]EDY39123.1 AMP-binding enzyme domain protein [Cyanobium sp. PCC 7001]
MEPSLEDRARSAGSSTAEYLHSSLQDDSSSKFHLIDENGFNRSLTFGNLGQRAFDVLATLQKAGLGPGSVLVIRSYSREDFISCLWACLLGNITALPIEAGIGEGPAREALHRKLLDALVDKKDLYVLDSVAARRLTGWRQRIHPSHWIRLNSNGCGAENQQARVHVARASDPRLLILTSGTTGQASLVELSDRAVCSRWWPCGPAINNTTKFLSWAPLDHAMGLSACSPNASCKVVLHTIGFLKDPLQWLELASNYRVTHTTMTSFGMKLILDALRQAPVARLNRINLSMIDSVGIGAEPLQPDVFRDFASALTDFGANSEIYVQSYGLTECGPVMSGRLNAHTFAVNSTTGFWFTDLNHDHEVRMQTNSDIQDEKRPDLGEIQVRGPSMATGYLNAAQDNGRLLTSDGWIRTGDVGRIQEGRLQLAGRIKETLILNAVKYPCQMVEDVALKIPGVATAIALQTSSRIDNSSSSSYEIIITEADHAEPSDSLAAKIVDQVGKEFGVRPSNVIVIPEAYIPRSSLGKVSRYSLGRMLESEESGISDVIKIYPAASRVAGTPEGLTPAELKIHELWSKVLGHQNFGIDDNFFAAGGDSLQAAQLALEIEKWLRRSVSIGEVFRHSSVRSQSSSIATRIRPDYPGQQASPSDSVGTEILIRRQTDMINDWSGVRDQPGSLIIRASRSGSRGKYPGGAMNLFWCFQGNQEFQSLAEMLPKKICLFGMRSGHLIMEETQHNIQSLATIYARELRRLQPDGRFILGGNCQGARIIRAVALILESQGRQVESLILMEDRRLEPYSNGRTTIIFGEDSEFNPLQSQPESEVSSRLRQSYPLGYDFYEISGSHGRFFNPEHVRSLADTVLQSLANNLNEEKSSLSVSNVPFRSSRESPPHLACIVISVGRSPLLVDAVRSLVRQNPKPEVVVVSTGGLTPAADLATAGLAVPVIHRRWRRFVGCARNIGIKKTTAPFIAFLADDCIARKGWVAERLRLHQTGAIAVSSALVPSDRKNLWSWISHLRLYSRRLPGIPEQEAVHYGISYERSLFDEFGLFREDLRVGEDSEFNARFQHLHQITWTPSVKTAHRHPTGFLGLLIDQFKRGRRRESTRAALPWFLPSMELHEKGVWAALSAERQHSQRLLHLARWGLGPQERWVLRYAPSVLPVCSFAFWLGSTSQRWLGGGPSETRAQQQDDRNPIIHVLLRFRNEARYLPTYLEHLEGKVDGIIALDDGSTDGSTAIVRSHPLVKELIVHPDRSDHVWDEAGDRRLLITTALQENADWLLVLDADERLEDNFRDRAIPILLQAFESGQWGLGLRVLDCWNAWNMVRTDGIWGRKSSPRLFLARHDHEFDNKPLHGAWAPLNSRSNGMFPVVDVIIYHLKMIRESDRIKRRQRYEQLDARSEYQSVGYSYLTDLHDIELTSFEANRGYSKAYAPSS